MTASPADLPPMPSKLAEAAPFLRLRMSSESAQQTRFLELDAMGLAASEGAAVARIAGQVLVYAVLDLPNGDIPINDAQLEVAEQLGCATLPPPSGP